MPLDMMDTFPMDHNHAVITLLNAPWDAEENRQLDKRDLVTLHHGFGTSLRNSWHLWDRTYPLTKHYIEKYGIGHADDISGLIIMDFLARRRGEKFDMDARVRQYKRYWSDQGLDPITQEKVKT